MATDDLSSRPWVLLPGTLCTRDVFDGMLDILGVDAGHRRVVPLDQSSVQDYAAVLGELGAQTIVCGFSLGAIVAAHCVDRMSVNSLVLFGLNPYADDPDKMAGRHALAEDVGVMGGSGALRARLGDIHGCTPGATRDAICRMADETASLIDVQTALALSRPGALPALAQAPMPIYCLSGSKDHMAPPGQGRAAAHAAPHGRFRALNGLGHFALLEDPAACAAALRQMMDPHHDIA